MSEVAVLGPFGQEPIEDIRLERAPLVRVLAQARYPSLVRMVGEGFREAALAVGEAMSDAYPLLGELSEMKVTITPAGIQQEPVGKLFQFRSSDATWQVTVGSASVAMDTSAYTTREDFCERFAAVLSAVQQEVSPPFVERLGFRYINRIDEEVELRRLGELVKPEVLGGLAVPLPEGVTLIHALSETTYRLPGGSLQARWGMVPGGAALDPSVPPLPHPSWVLDLDSFTEGQLPFVAGDIAARTGSLSLLAYRFFRWAVTPQFLTTFGSSE